MARELARYLQPPTRRKKAMRAKLAARFARMILA